VTSTHVGGDDGRDDELARQAAQGIGEFEQYLALFRAPKPLPLEAADVDDDGLVDEPTGETERVRELAAEVAEGERLRELYAKQLALNLDTPRVRKRRRSGQEAAKLHVLSRLPAVRALQARTALRVINAAAFTALTLALGWSTVGVHAFAAAGALAWSPEWLVGWFVEPFLSLALLSIVGAKAFFATRGHMIESPTLERIEWTFLGLTLGMNVYPTIPGWVGPAERFELPALVLHSLGPIVAVSIVRGLPRLWAEFGKLDHGLTDALDSRDAGSPTGYAAPGGPLATAPTGSPTPPLYRGNAGPQVPEVPEKVRDLTARAVRLLKTGELSGNPPGAGAIRKALGCGTDLARAVRDQLTKGGV
jgi:hypothetical protein